MSAPVVVSAGEPVAWLVQGPIEGTLPWVALSPAEADQARERGHTVTPIPASAPVVLPEEPPAELIEAMAKAAYKAPIWGNETPLAWEFASAFLRNAYLAEARANYAALRSWVAGGGETR